MTFEADRGPYGRRKEKRADSWPEQRQRADAANPSRRYSGETYYDRPALKASHYRWAIISYLFVGGIAGASQMIATIADLTGRGEERQIVRAGRYTALLGAMLSPILLISDLGTPQRWYNMLRIFRPTSAMSIGSWTLFTFGTLSGLTAAAQLLDDVLHVRLGRGLARLLGVPAAVAGMMMSVYTGTLLSATSVPLWAAANPFLSPLFGTSAMATASAMLSLVLRLFRAPPRAIRQIERLGLIASGAELALSITVTRRVRRAGVDGPLQEPRLRAASRFGVLGLGIIVPLIGHIASLLSRRDRQVLSTLAAVATLVGGFIQRGVMIFAGNISAKRPEDYFRYRQANGTAARHNGEAEGQ